MLEEQIGFFVEHGYWVEKQALDVDHVERLNQVVNMLFQDVEGREVPDIIDRHEIFHPLLIHPPTFSLIKALMGRKVQMESVNATRVRPGKGLPVGWHMDNHVYPDPVPPLWFCPQSVNCLFYLDDISPEKGPLRIVPGSHRSGKNPPPGIEPIDGEIAICASAGDAVLFHGALWHAAGPNVSGEERRTLNYNYIQSFCKQRTDHFAGSYSGQLREHGSFYYQQLLGKFDGWQEVPEDVESLTP